MSAFHQCFEANTAVPSLVRREFARWLNSLGWPADQADDLVLALSEAVTNAVEHAYPDAGPSDERGEAGTLGQVRVSAEESTCPCGEGHRVRIEVADTGRWRPIPADPGHRGRGLPMMDACTESLIIDPSPAGTQVIMISHLARPRPGTPRHATHPAPRQHHLRNSRLRGRLPGAGKMGRATW